MEKPQKKKTGTTPLQQFSQKLVILRLLMDTGVIGLVISSMFFFYSQSQENEYGFQMADEMEELLKKSTLEDKFSLVKFEAPYCFPCTHDAPVHGKSYFQPISDQYVMYRLNALDLDGEGPTLTMHYDVEVLPTWLVLNAEGEEVFRWESQGFPPVETLGRVEALRGITASTDHTVQFSGTPEEATQLVYTLNWQSNLSYWDAIKLAERLEPLVLESVWTQPDSSGTWTVCSGTYHGIIEARTSRLFHTEWREQPLEIVKLRESGWQLPSP